LAGLYVGDIVQAHRAAAARALQLARTLVPREVARDADVAVVNAYPLDTDPIQMAKGLSLGRALNVRLAIAINAASDGIFYHGMGMGSGVSLARLIRNVPRLVTSWRSLRAWAASLAVAAPRPQLLARSTYFALNHLSYAAFGEGDGRRELDEPIPAVPEEHAGPWVLSPRMPTWGFRRRYPRGLLFRDWGTLRSALEHRFAGRREPRVLVFPCAPLQRICVE
jgi:hypothetical protein